MSLPVAAAGARILELESIRGLAALIVFLHHIPAWNEALYGLSILRNGQLMVDLFFVLSGYVICLNYGERLRGAADIARFQFLRLGRLYPIHLAVLLGFLAAEAAKLVAQERYGIAFGRPAFEHISAANLAANLTLTQALGALRDLPVINGPSWSISVEFYIYLLFALVAAGLAALPVAARSAAYALLSAGAMALLLALGEHDLLRHSDLLRGLAGFFLGCLAALASARLERAGAPAPRWAPVAAALALVAYLALKPQGAVADLLVYPLTAALILALVHSEGGAVKAALNWAPVVKLGALSYSLYMFHFLVIWCADNVMRLGFKATRLPLGAAVAAYAATIAATLLVSWLAWRYIEQPWREKSRRVVRRAGA